MRVIEPHQLKGARKHKKKFPKKPFLLIAVIIIAGLIVYKIDLPAKFKSRRDARKSSDTQTTPENVVSAQPIAKTGKIKIFTGQEFKDLYYLVAYPNTQQIVDPLPITGNEIADARIRELAEERGYKQTSVPQGSIIKIDEPRLEKDNLLQPLAAQSWQSLKDAAKKEGLPLTIISAYRSPEYQRNLFAQRLIDNGTTARLIADGIGDSAINRTLGMTAVPGYSRHHTGYTIDLWCEDGSSTFLGSSCYQWISKDNHLHAKESGWIPSYPEGTDLQGPEPEPWEYVWVGTDNLRE